MGRTLVSHKLLQVFSGWLGGAVVLGNFQCQGILLIWIIVGQGLTKGVGGVVWTLFSPLSFLFFLSVSGRQPDID